MSINQRLREYIKYKKISQSEFAKRLDVSPQTINQYLKSEGINFGFKMINRITDAFPALNETWLLTGEGKMETTNSQDDIKASAENTTTASEKEILLQTVIAKQEEIITMLKEQLAECKKKNL